MMNDYIRIDCPLCSGRNFINVRRLNSYQLVRCKCCDFIFVNPRPAEEIIIRAYQDKSKQDGLNFTFIHNIDFSVNKSESWTSNFILRQLFKNDRKHTGAFLDIGAGHGWAVEWALNHGFDAFGYEIGSEKKFSAEVENRIFNNRKQLKDSGLEFDYMLCSAVIEHVYNPLEFLKEWFPLLKPGGYLMISGIPNIDSVFIKTRIDSWDGNIPLIHLNYFTKKTIMFLLSQFDCHILSVFTMGVPVSFSTRNIFKQRKYSEKYWGDNISMWPSMAANSNYRRKSAIRLKLMKYTVPMLNHFLSFDSLGANINVLIQKGF